MFTYLCLVGMRVFATEIKLNVVMQCNMHSLALILAIYTCQGKTSPIPVAERSKARVCGRSHGGTASSNPAGGMDVSLL